MEEIKHHTWHAKDLANSGDKLPINWCKMPSINKSKFTFLQAVIPPSQPMWLVVQRFERFFVSVSLVLTLPAINKASLNIPQSFWKEISIEYHFFGCMSGWDLHLVMFGLSDFKSMLIFVDYFDSPVISEILGVLWFLISWDFSIIPISLETNITG